MTFQVGIVATDGILLASDRCLTRYLESGSRATSQQQKIFFNRNTDVAYCSCGDDWASLAAKIHADEFTPDCEIAENMDGARRKAIKACIELEGVERARARHGTVLCVHRRGKELDLWSMDLGPSVITGSIVVQAGPRYPASVTARIWSGDYGNSAVYFLERHLREGAIPLPLQSLKFIAAHAVRTASKINPSGIEGLEILICTKDSFTWVSQREVRDLEARSDELDSKIAVELGITPAR